MVIKSAFPVSRDLDPLNKLHLSLDYVIKTDKQDLQEDSLPHPTTQQPHLPKHCSKTQPRLNKLAHDSIEIDSINNKKNQE